MLSDGIFMYYIYRESDRGGEKSIYVEERFSYLYRYSQFTLNRAFAV